MWLQENFHSFSLNKIWEAAEWKPFQTALPSYITEIWILPFNEQQKAKEWDKLGAPDHGSQHVWQSGEETH